MSPGRLRRLKRLPGRLQRRARAARATLQERRFEPRLRLDPDAPELLLSPHWDDAVLGCWSVLAGERPLQVVNVFGGIPPAGERTAWEEIIGARDTAERARRRLAEDALALGKAGRTALNLPLLDAQLRPPAVAIGLHDIDRALAAHVAGASRVYAPAGIGGHADHLLARRYACALVHVGIPVELYAELPYCTFHGWPPWVDGSEPEPQRNVDAYWLSFLGGVAAMPPLRSASVLRLDPSAAQARAQAIGCYETSLNHGVRKVLADPAIHALEVRWSLVRKGKATRSGGEGAEATAPAVARS